MWEITNGDNQSTAPPSNNPSRSITNEYVHCTNSSWSSLMCQRKACRGHAQEVNSHELRDDALVREPINLVRPRLQSKNLCHFVRRTVYHGLSDLIMWNRWRQHRIFDANSILRKLASPTLMCESVRSVEPSDFGL